jgi:bacteriocin biosynthesis cyclodehydratase domain-containing protein
MSHSSNIRIIAHGSFGHAVTEHLTAVSGRDGRAVQVAGVPSGHGLRDFLAGGNLGILASFRDVASDLDAFAAAAAWAGVAWLPVALSPHHARVGPLVVPGAAPCHVCYSARLAQHGQAAGTASTDLGHAFERDEALGVEGYPPHIAVIAAGLAMTLAYPRPGADLASRLFLIDITSDAVASWRVISVQGCPECDSAANASAAMAERTGRLRALAAEICPSPGG